MLKEHRTRAEWLAQRINHVSMSGDLRAVLDGVLLSDGSLHRRGVRQTANLLMHQHPQRRGWLLQLQADLTARGLVIKMGTSLRGPVTIRDQELPGGRRYDILRSLNYAELVGEYSRWYPQGTKVVPRDLRLTPTVLLHWFCGDGRGGDRKGTLGFCTDGFTLEDVDFLVTRFQEDLGVTVLRTQARGRPQILVSQRDEAVKVKTLLEPLIPACCAYKLQHVRPLQTQGRGRKLSEALRAQIQLEKGTCTVRDAALRHGVSVSKVWTIWNES